MGRVDNKVALISGGGSGLGKASAGMLAQEGAKVAIADINLEAAQQAAAEISSAGDEALALELDVRSEASWHACIEQVMARYGKLNILMNNAGVVAGGDVENSSLEEWHKIMSVNLDGVFLGTQCGIRAMRETGEPGSIINMSSIEGMVGHPMVAAYNASKGGVRTLTKSAALYCAQQRLPIRVNSIHPGGISTPLLEAGLAALPPGERETFVAEHPIGHLGEPDDVAYGVLYLASDESKFVLGAELVVDGGYLAK